MYIIVFYILELYKDKEEFFVKSFFFFFKRIWFLKTYTQHCLELLYSKNYLNLTQKKLFWGHSKWQQINHSTPEVCYQIFAGWEVKIMWNSWKNVCDVYRETCFRQKMLTNGLNLGLLLQAWVEKIVYGAEMHWLSGKEKVLGVAISKKVILTLHWCMLRTYDYWFPWKRWNCKQYFLLPTSYIKFTLFIK